jgi:ABC-type nitrate/sulfonate/bicarbonate transport system substrate-binding protein
MLTRLVRLGVFSPSVLLGVAAADGTLDRAGLRVEEIPVASSSHQFTLLLAGELDAVLTSPDNVLAYRGSSANPLGRAVDVRILAAVDRGLGLSLFSVRGLRIVGPPGIEPRARLSGAGDGIDAAAGRCADGGTLRGDGAQRG